MARSEPVREWHVVTGEYPPDSGGVADYTATVAEALADAGDRVTVWTSGTTGRTAGRVVVHRALGAFTRRDLARGTSLLAEHGRSGRLLIQWVPHAFGRHGVNMRAALWLHAQATRRAGGVDVMIHEPFMPFAGPMTHRVAAAIQRAMTATVLHAATRAFAATPAWIDKCRPFARGVGLRWSPIPSGIPVEADQAEVEARRRAWQSAPGERLVGCFGRAGAFQEAVLDDLGQVLATGAHRTRLLLIGFDSDAVLARLAGRHPPIRAAVRATGAMAPAAVSVALRACDVMIQPYAAGICARHSSAAALLAHGLPIVTNSGPFTEPAWAESRAVALLPAQPAALTQAALRLLDDAPERRRLSHAARDLYDARFHVRHTVAALRE